MTIFTRQTTCRLPAGPVGRILEFSPTGECLAISGNAGRGVRIVDFTNCPSTVSLIDTPETPSSFVWDHIQPGRFIVGFVDGTFTSFAKGREETRVHSLRDRGPVTALALSNDSMVLAAIVDSDHVFIFRRDSFAGRHISLLSTHDDDQRVYRQVRV